MVTCNERKMHVIVGMATAEYEHLTHLYFTFLKGYDFRLALSTLRFASLQAFKHSKLSSFKQAYKQAYKQAFKQACKQAFELSSFQAFKQSKQKAGYQVLAYTCQLVLLLAGHSHPVRLLHIRL